MKVLAPVCIDGSSDHDTQTGHELDDGRQDEPLSLLEAEELEQKDEEGDAGEDGGEDHGGLHRLHHRITFKRFRAGQLIDLGTVCAVGAHSPEVSREAVAYPPGIVNGRNEQECRGHDVEDNDEGKNHQHVHRAVKAKGAAGSPKRDEETKMARDKSKPGTGVWTQWRAARGARRRLF